MLTKFLKGSFGVIPAILLTMAAAGCGVDGDPAGQETAPPFNPDKPVSISDFIPKTGGMGTKLVIYGENFGNDASLVTVTIGGEKAQLINVKGDCLYCLVPPRSMKGDIRIEVGSGDAAKSFDCEEKFNYQARLRVGTLCGTKNDKGEFEVKDGPFDDCGGIDNPCFFSFDPVNRHHLYMSQDGQALRMFDLENKQLYTVISNSIQGMGRMRSITWTNDENHDMVIACDNWGLTDPSNVIVHRSSPTASGPAAFKAAPEHCTQSITCNGSSIHPVNGLLYYNCYNDSQFFSYDLSTGTKQGEVNFSLGERGWEYNNVIHPGGDYMYIVVINKSYISKATYNPETKKFNQPTVFVGSGATWNETGYVDGVGTSARINNAYQGIFVKNEEYVAQGKEDVYDFYFSDQFNHCIRKVTPEGIVSTFAGRGGVGAGQNAWGYADGDARLEARFDQPRALAYDESTQTFYVGDHMNRRIRTIYYE